IRECPTHPALSLSTRPPHDVVSSLSGAVPAVREPAVAAGEGLTGLAALAAGAAGPGPRRDRPGHRPLRAEPGGGRETDAQLPRSGGGLARQGPGRPGLPAPDALRRRSPRTPVGASPVRRPAAPPGPPQG